MKYNIRDKKGRFARKSFKFKVVHTTPKRIVMQLTPSNIPGIDNSNVIKSQPNIISEDGAKWGGEPLDTSNRVSNKSWDPTILAWIVGVACGIASVFIYQYFYP